MRIIIPMAGRGTRLRPHTLVTPKPLLPIAGKPIVQRLAEDIVEIYDGKVDEISFIVGDFGDQVERDLISVAESLGAKGVIYRQDQPLGTAHALWMAEKSLVGEVIIAFADTLFQADFKIDKSKDGAIWVKRVEDPSRYGVVTLDTQGVIDGMVEKPSNPVSDLAIIGIYYIKDGYGLREEIRHLIENDIREKGEYQLTNALENMRLKGASLVPGEVLQWMDCGSMELVLDTNVKVLDIEHSKGKNLIHPTAQLENVTLIPPCFIAEGAKIRNSVIGPHVAIGNNSEVHHSVISRSILRENAKVSNAVLRDTMAGAHSRIEKHPNRLDLGDYSRAL